MFALNNEKTANRRFFSFLYEMFLENLVFHADSSKSQLGLFHFFGYTVQNWLNTVRTAPNTVQKYENTVQIPPFTVQTHFPTKFKAVCPREPLLYFHIGRSIID